MSFCASKKITRIMESSSWRKIETTWPGANRSAATAARCSAERARICRQKVLTESFDVFRASFTTTEDDIFEKTRQVRPSHFPFAFAESAKHKCQRRRVVLCAPSPANDPAQAILKHRLKPWSTPPVPHWAPGIPFTSLLVRQPSRHVRGAHEVTRPTALPTLETGRAVSRAPQTGLGGWLPRSPTNGANRLYPKDFRCEAVPRVNNPAAPV